ncbi:phosphopantothenoylcysteine synthase [bacterium]|nr:phosphopantothenoylcysteine synthase [bacterium]
MRVLITAGGTRAYIDEIRWLGNVSSGRFGAEIALAALERGAEVTHFYSERAISPIEKKIDITGDMAAQLAEAKEAADRFAPLKDRYRDIKFLSLESYQQKLEQLLTSEHFDVIFLAAAVSDYAPVAQTGKIPSDQEHLTLELNRVPKTIERVKDWAPDIYQVGFKLLVGTSTEVLIEAAEKSARHNHSDCIVANDLDLLRESRHTIHLVRLGHPTETYSVDDNPAENLVDRVFEWVREKQKLQSVAVGSKR